MAKKIGSFLDEAELQKVEEGQGLQVFEPEIEEKVEKVEGNETLQKVNLTGISSKKKIVWFQWGTYNSYKFVPKTKYWK